MLLKFCGGQRNSIPDQLNSQLPTPYTRSMAPACRGGLFSHRRFRHLSTSRRTIIRLAPFSFGRLSNPCVRTESAGPNGIHPGNPGTAQLPLAAATILSEDSVSVAVIEDPRRLGGALMCAVG
jgi:hypothetical protein